MKIRRIIAAVMALTIVGANCGMSGSGLSRAGYAHAEEVAEEKETIEIDGVTYVAVEGGYALCVNTIKGSSLIEDGVCTIPDEADGVPVVALTGELMLGGKSLKLGKNIRSIGKNCFMHSYFKEIELNDALENIGDYAFRMSEMETIKIGPNVRYIGVECFEGCENLKEVIFEESDDAGRELMIGKNAFWHCKQLADIQLCNGIKYIPEMCFRGTAVSSVVLPDSVEEVGPSAFDACEELKELKCGKGLKRIGKDAFSMSPITKIEFNEGLVEIFDMAFSQAKLDNVTLPETLEYIGVCVFSEVHGDIVLPASVNYLGGSNFFRCDGKTDTLTILNPECIILSDPRVKEIRGYKGSTAEERAGRINGVDFVAIEDDEIKTPTEIMIVDECRYDPVEGGYELKKIGDDVTDLVIPDEIDGYPVIAINGNVSANSTDREKLVSVKLGKNVKTIGRSAFLGYEKLTSVELNDGLKEIKQGAFNGTALGEVILPKSVESVGESAFHNMKSGGASTGCVTVNNPECVLEDGSIKYMNIAGYKGSTAEKYANDAKLTFFDIEDETTPHIPYLDVDRWYEPVEGGYALAGIAKEMTELIIPDEVNGYAVVAVRDNMYMSSGHDAKLTSVKLGKNVKTIGERAFQNCDTIKELELNDVLESVGNYAFASARYIESELVFPETIKSIGKRAFDLNGDCPSATILNPDCGMGENCISGTLIVGYEGSTAQKYAEENGYPFRALEGTPRKAGDTNCDGKVELADAILIMQALANPNKYGTNGTAERHLTETGKLNGDVDKDVEGLTPNDALKIQEYLLGKVESL